LVLERDVVLGELLSHEQLLLTEGARHLLGRKRYDRV
jgi:hypothetical protein